MSKEFIKVPNGRTLYNVLINEITHVYSKGGCSEIHLPNGVKFVWNKTLRKIMSKLNGHKNFVQTHRSFIANVKMVKAYRSDKAGGKAIMISGRIVDISRRQKPEFLRKYKAI